jgi:hypothetical protein
MMFLIGQGERTVVVGPPEPQHCPMCEEETAFTPQLTYSFGEFDLLFGFTYNKRYQLACPQCNHGWILDTKEMERTLGKVPIPFRLRYGIIIFASLAAAIALSSYAYRHAA